MGEMETLVIKYKGPKEHIAAIRAAAEDMHADLETFVHYCIVKYLEAYWWPRRVAVPTKLYRLVADEAKKQGVSVDELVSEIVEKFVKEN